MKTTVELPDELLRRTKMLAASRGTTLKELMIEGLERVTGDDPLEPEARAARVFDAMDRVPSFSAAGRLSRDETHER